MADPSARPTVCFLSRGLCDLLPYAEPLAEQSGSAVDAMAHSLPPQAWQDERAVRFVTDLEAAFDGPQWRELLGERGAFRLQEARVFEELVARQLADRLAERHFLLSGRRVQHAVAAVLTRLRGTARRRPAPVQAGTADDDGTEAEDEDEDGPFSPDERDLHALNGRLLERARSYWAVFAQLCETGAHRVQAEDLCTRTPLAFAWHGALRLARLPSPRLETCLRYEAVEQLYTQVAAAHNHEVLRRGGARLEPLLAAFALWRDHAGSQLRQWPLGAELAAAGALPLECSPLGFRLVGRVLLCHAQQVAVVRRYETLRGRFTSAPSQSALRGSTLTAQATSRSALFLSAEDREQMLALCAEALWLEEALRSVQLDLQDALHVLDAGPPHGAAGLGASSASPEPASARPLQRLAAVSERWTLACRLALAWAGAELVRQHPRLLRAAVDWCDAAERVRAEPPRGA